MRTFLRQVFGDRRDTEQLIFEIAEHNRGSDYEELYKRLSDTTLYMPIDGESLPTDIPPGHTFQVGSDDQIRACTVSIPNLGTCIPVATQDTADMLKSGYVGINWQEFLTMVQKCDAAGALVQGKSSWVAFDMERIRYIQSRNGA